MEYSPYYITSLCGFFKGGGGFNHSHALNTSTKFQSLFGFFQII